MKPEIVESFGQPSFTLNNDRVSVAVTKLGGHLAPAAFHFRRRVIQPLSIAPWWNEKVAGPAIIRVLRGDFFCMPFGSNSEAWKDERHEIHGDTANRAWAPVAVEETGEGSRLRLRLRTKTRPGVVEKIVELRKNHAAIYQRHVISEMSGPMSFGHHAMLRFPSEGLIATSPFRFGQVNPGEPENPAHGGYSCLKRGAEFASLASLPMSDGGSADLSRYPAREGFEDLALIASEPDLDFAWTAVSFPKERYLWIAFKDPRVLASTVFWHSNGGRHYAPWNGRHRAVLGLEEVTSFFAEGIHQSVRKNSLNARGIPTALTFSKTKPTAVNYLMAVAEIPAGFGRVKTVRDLGAQRVEIGGERGSIQINLDLAFLHGQN